jgi:hypothetical protein
MQWPITADATIALNSLADDAPALELIRHDLAHIMARAVQDIWECRFYDGCMHKVIGVVEILAGISNLALFGVLVAIVFTDGRSGNQERAAASQDSHSLTCPLLAAGAQFAPSSTPYSARAPPAAAAHLPDNDALMALPMYNTNAVSSRDNA